MGLWKETTAFCHWIAVWFATGPGHAIRQYGNEAEALDEFSPLRVMTGNARAPVHVDDNRQWFFHAHLTRHTSEESARDEYFCLLPTLTYRVPLIFRCLCKRSRRVYTESECQSDDQ